MLVITIGADVKTFSAEPIFPISTFFADKTLGPFDGKKVIITCVRI
jgi:hypothetical protein